MRLTGSRYDGMDDRMERKGLSPLPFSKAQFRAHVLSALDGREDGYAQCRYCHAFCELGVLAVDHAMPLSRGGSPGLDNLELVCKPCNNRKGSMTPAEFLALLAFLETIPLARIDVLKRLEQSVSLAAGARANAGVISDLKRFGTWQQAQAVRRAAKKEGQHGR